MGEKMMKSFMISHQTTLKNLNGLQYINGKSEYIPGKGWN